MEINVFSDAIQIILMPPSIDEEMLENLGFTAAPHHVGIFTSWSASFSNSRSVLTETFVKVMALFAEQKLPLSFTLNIRSDVSYEEYDQQQRIITHGLPTIGGRADMTSSGPRRGRVENMPIMWEPELDSLGRPTGQHRPTHKSPPHTHPK